jgi:hypothetical protein
MACLLETAEECEEEEDHEDDDQQLNEGHG